MEEESGSPIDLVAAFDGQPMRADRFSIYIPNKDRTGAPVAQAPWVDAFLDLLTDINGGASALPAMTGAWRDPETGIVVIEEPVVVYTFIDAAQFESRLGEIVELVKKMGRETNQGEVAMEFNGEFFTTNRF